MAFEHPSGLPHAYDRSVGRRDLQSVVFNGKRPLFQGAELNDLQRIARGRHDRLGRLIAKDGDRVSGAAALVDIDAATVSLDAGTIYASGDVFPVAARVLTGVAMTGTVALGIRLVRTWITHLEDPTLVGLVEGSDAEGEPGAARESVSIEWVDIDAALAASPGAPLPDEYYPVYSMKDGTIIDQTPPPLLEGIKQGLRIYDRPHGHYIVTGCRVTALGLGPAGQIFSIEQGEFNIDGIKIERFAALRHIEPEDWDSAPVAGETHTYTGGASQKFYVQNTPVDEITSILLTKERTAVMTRGNVAGTADPLPDASVISIIEVKQGLVTYAPTADYARVGDAVSWAAGGAEPLTGSSYTVKYRYRVSVSPVSSDLTSFTVSGGALNSDVIVSYTHKLQRVDALCLDQSGLSVYVKGISAKSNPLAPTVPNNLLTLCRIGNSWFGTPTVLNDGVRFVPVWQQWKFFNRILDHDRLIQLERLKSGIDRREPVVKKGTFVDPFENDFYRDLGVAQTASVGGGVLQLAVQPTFYLSPLASPVTLDFIEEIVASQLLKTGCVKINPYANFNPLPGYMLINPPVDYWADTQTVWASPATLEFNAGISTVRATSTALDQGQATLSSSSTVTQQVNDAVVDFRSEQSSFLRQIQVFFGISGFGPGEVLTSLTFDGVNVKAPGPVAADGAGQISGSFFIPANVPVGTKVVAALGAGGTYAQAFFTGNGLINITTMRRTTTLTRSTVNTITTIGGGGGAVRQGGTPDPQAQLFALPEARQIIGVDFHLCALGTSGNHIMLNQVSVDNGYPTSDVLAEAFVNMTGAVTGWKSGRYTLPLTTTDASYHAFVIKSDDNAHSVSMAGLGQFDVEQQRFVTAHPYSIGPRFDSVNAETWTAHQGEALTFRLVAAKYTQTSKTVALGTFDVVSASDFQVRAVVDLPSPQCDVVFEVVRASGEVYRMRSHQVVRLAEFITETVTLRAVLTGTDKLSPILYAPVAFLTGRIALEATYVSRSDALGPNMTLTTYIKAHLPNGAGLTMQYDKADGNWLPLPLAATEALPDPRWVELKHSEAAISGAAFRLRIILAGGPAARPELFDFGAALI